MSLYVAFTKTSRLGCWLQWNAATECNVMLPLAASPMHYYPCRYDEILPPGATQSCPLNGSRLDCQIQGSVAYGDSGRNNRQ